MGKFTEGEGGLSEVGPKGKVGHSTNFWQSQGQTILRLKTKYEGQKSKSQGKRLKSNRNE